jgi:hypothetical protein
MHTSRYSFEGIEAVTNVSYLLATSSGVSEGDVPQVAVLLQNTTGGEGAADCVHFDQSTEVVAHEPSGVVV